MRIKKFVQGPIGTNCYVVQNEETKECFVVDLALWQPSFLTFFQEEGLQAKAVLLTHGHFDHMMGVEKFIEKVPVPVYVMEEEKPLLCDARLNASSSMYGEGFVFSEAQGLRDGQTLSVAGFQVQVIHTPGHTVGGCCYYLPQEGVLFSGDTLFQASVGRTDLPTGSGSQIVRSVREKLFVLPEDTMVYPGHMEETTIGSEKKYNPFV